MREVKAGWVQDAVLASSVEAGGHKLLSDEPIAEGGGDLGPTSHQLLLSALAACITMTLRLYARRKGWPLTDTRVHVTGEHVDGRYVIRRHVELDGGLDAEQRTRLLEISGRCPVHRTLTGEIQIEAN